MNQMKTVFLQSMSFLSENEFTKELTVISKRNH